MSSLILMGWKIKAATLEGRLWPTVWPLGLILVALGFFGFTKPVSLAGDPSLVQKNSQIQTDEVIRMTIEKRLRMDSRIDWELLQVEIVQGHATLYGEVRTAEEKGLAALIASTVPAVRGLTNSIIVEPAATLDHSLSKAIWRVLRGVPTLNGNDTLRVKVKHGVVKLEGSVAHSIQKEAAEKATQSVPGVATVINLIEVNGKAYGENTGSEKMLQEGVQVQP